MPSGRDPLEHLSPGEWRLRPMFQKSDPDELAQQQAMDEYLIAQHNRMYRFAEPWPVSIKDDVHKLYRDSVAVLSGGMGCMQAAYQCLETIHKDQPKYADPGRESLREKVYDVSVKEKKYNNVELMMAELQKRGLAGEPLVVGYDAKAKGWEYDPEKELMKTFDAKKEGVYFYGVSVAKGEHTALLAVENVGGAQKVYWLDQHSKGLDATTEVTGTLGTKLGEVWKDPARPNRIWPLRPEQLTPANP